MPNTNIDSDHRPVIIKRNTEYRKTINKKVIKDVINLRKLQDNVVKEQIKQEMKELFSNLPGEYSDIDTEWTCFKTAMLDILKTKCGIRKVGNVKRLRTIWWNNEVKDSISKKKTACKKWLKSKSQQDYVHYRLARREAKRKINTSKEESWRNYGERMATTQQL